MSKDRTCLNFVTYHFSRGDAHRGCAGHEYDTKAAYASSLELKKQYVRVFGQGVFYTILVGMETDLDALVLHGEHEGVEPLDLSTMIETSPDHLESLIRALYPNMPAGTMAGFMQLVLGNVEHIRETRVSNRVVADIVHQEKALCLGRGFDWLHVPNKAIIVGPFDPELRAPIATAAKLLLSNLEEGRIPEEGGVALISSAPYREHAGYDRPAACEKAEWLASFGKRVIEQDVPKLLPYLSELTTVVDEGTRQLEVLHRR